MNTLIYKATVKKAILFSILFAGSYILINFTGIGVASLLKITNGANILDFEFGYSQEMAYQMLTALGTEGRAFYLSRIVPMDFPFPFTYMLCYAGWITLLLKLNTLKAWSKYLLFIPVFAMLFDWLENLGIIVMLWNYPNLPAWAVYTASGSGMLKTVFTVGSIATIVVLLIIFGLSRLKNR